METRKMLSMVAAAALIALPGCSTDDAVKKDAEKAQPKVEQAGEDAGNAAEDAADKIDDNDSK
jgi:outer membrane protein assembly factor BamE (lipoprotein component of BamABCDE complex)